MEDGTTVADAMDAHQKDSSNPHSVTAEQVAIDKDLGVEIGIGSRTGDELTVASALNKTAYRSQGVTSEFRATSPGWKRIAVLIRGNSGMIDIVCTGAGMRSSQNILLGYSAWIDALSSKFLNNTTSHAELTDQHSKPFIWQASNNWWGSDRDTLPRNKLAYIDKVRLAYPVNWDEIDTSGMTEEQAAEYQNPVNVYFDVHVVAEPSFFNSYALSIESNITGHTDNHRIFPVHEELSCATDPTTGYIVGYFNGVLCKAYEFSLVDNSALHVEDCSRMDKLSVGALWRHQDVEYVLNSGLSLPGDRAWHRLKSLSINTTATDYSVQSIRENMLVPVNYSDYTNATRGSGYQIHKNGILAFNGSDNITGNTYFPLLRQLPSTAGGANPYANAVPIVLRKGEQYLARDCWIHVMTVDKYREAVAAGSAFATTLTNYYALSEDKVGPATLAIPIDEENDRVVVAVSIYFQEGKDYTGRCWYPQLCRADVGVVETDPYPSAPDDVITREKPFSAKATTYSGEDGLSLVGIDYAVELQVWSDDDPDISGTAVVETASKAEYLTPADKESLLHEIETTKDTLENEIVASQNEEIFYACVDTANHEWADNGDGYFYMDVECEGVVSGQHPWVGVGLPVGAEDDVSITTLVRWQGYFNQIEIVEVLDGMLRLYSAESFSMIDDGGADEMMWLQARVK